MNGAQFESHVTDLLAILGYEIEFRRQPSFGKEVDILGSCRIPGLKRPFRVAVECKYRTPPRHVGNDEVIAFLNHVALLRRNGVVDRGLLVSNQPLSQKAFLAFEGQLNSAFEFATPELLLRRIIPHPNFIETVISRCHRMLCMRAQIPHVEPPRSATAHELGYFVWPTSFAVRGEPGTTPIEAWLRQWLGDHSRSRLLILGKPGAGKTWLSIALILHAARSYEEVSSMPIPFFVPARGWRLNEPFHLHVSRQMQEFFGIAIPASDAFQRLLESPQALVVLDGLDELQAEMESAQRRSLWAAAMKTSHENKLVVTCRSSYASNQLVDRGLTGIAHDAHRDDVITLKDFTDSDVESCLGRAFPEEAARIRDVLNSQDGLLELCRRPALMALAFDMVGKQQVPMVTASNIAELYNSHTSLVMQEDMHRVGTIDLEVLRDVHCALAWIMHVEHATSVRTERLRSQIGEHLTHPENNSQLALRAIHHSSLVHVTKSGHVSFVHMLLREYFLALRIVERLRRNLLHYGDLDERVDSDVLSGFLKSMLSLEDSESLIGLLQHEEQPWHQYFGAYYLSRLRAMDYSTVLLKKYRSTDHPMLKREFALALANLGRTEEFEEYFRPVLLGDRKLAEHNNRWIEHFFGDDRDAAVRACAARLRSVQDYPGRAMLLHFLGQFGYASHRPLIEGFIHDDSSFVREVAAAALDEYEQRLRRGRVSEGGPRVRTPTLLLDFDGVLVDTLGDHVEAWNHAFEEIGIAVNTHEIALSEGMHPMAVTEDIARSRGRKLLPGQAERIVKAKNREFLEKASVVLTEAAQKVLRTAEEWGGRAAIVTASQRSVVETALKGLGCRVSPIIVSPETLADSKPAPGPYLRAAKELSADPKDCVAIENSPPGIEAARTAGMPCVAVTSTLDPSYLRDATDIASDLTGALQLVRILRHQGQPYPDPARLDEPVIDFVEKSLSLSYQQFDIDPSIHGAIFDAVRTFQNIGDRSRLSQKMFQVRDKSFRQAYEKYQEETRPTWIADIARSWLVGPNVVDVGCGKNRLGHCLLREYRDIVGNVIGTDVNPVAASGSSIEFRLHDPDSPYRVPCEDASADTVVMANMLHHVPLFDQVTMLKDCRRILRAGGQLILVEDGYSSRESPRQDWEDLGATFVELDEHTIQASLSLLDWIGTYFGAGAVSMPRPFSFRRLEDWGVLISFLGLKTEHLEFLGFPRSKLHLNPQILVIARKDDER